MTETDPVVEAAYEAGLALMGAGAYFEAHEALEDWHGVQRGVRARLLPGARPRCRGLVSVRAPQSCRL